ncbi:MAG: hypothetical protein ACE5Z5_02140 [Candidatus Bathyarchaeia archaeon]
MGENAAIPASVLEEVVHSEAIHQAHPTLRLVMGTHSSNLGWSRIRDQYPRVVV